MGASFFIYLVVSGPLGRLHALAIVNTGEHGSQFTVLHFFGQIPRIAGSRRGSIFKFLEAAPRCFPSWPHQFTSSQRSTRGPSTPRPRQGLLSLVFFGNSCSSRYFMVVLMLIFPLCGASSTYLSVTCMTSFEKCLFRCLGQPL